MPLVDHLHSPAKRCDGSLFTISFHPRTSLRELRVSARFRGNPNHSLRQRKKTSAPDQERERQDKTKCTSTCRGYYCCSSRACMPSRNDEETRRQWENWLDNTWPSRHTHPNKPSTFSPYSNHVPLFHDPNYIGVCNSTTGFSLNAAWASYFAWKRNLRPAATPHPTIHHPTETHTTTNDHNASPLPPTRATDLFLESHI